MSRRIHPSWVVLASLENPEANRCVDIFQRPDGSFGFEEFRRDAEDGGLWTPVQFFSAARHDTRELALVAARRAVGWLAASDTISH